MSDPRIYEANLPPASPSDHLATPSNDLFLNTRPRSASSVSLHSSQSHVTIVEDKEHDLELEKKPLHRKQTIKIHRTFSFWEWCKGLFDREGMMQKIGDSIEVVSTNEPDETMFDHKESPFSKTVYISPRTNSTQYITARCLFDTGCYKGNIVSRSLVERLGYKEEDFEPLSLREAAHGQTVTGEPVIVDAVVRLSWHHNTSPQTYRHMRFLVSSTTQCDMIVGAHSIVKYKLFDELIYASQGSLHVPDLDENLVKLKRNLAKLESSVENYDLLFRKATAEKEKEKYRQKLEEKRHLRDVAEKRTEAARLEVENAKNRPKKPTPDQKAAAAKIVDLIARTRKDADEMEHKWAEEHPPPTPTPAAASGSTRRRSGPQLVVTSPTVSSVGDSHVKKSSSTKKGPQPPGSSQKKA